MRELRHRHGFARWPHEKKIGIILMYGIVCWYFRSPGFILPRSARTEGEPAAASMLASATLGLSIALSAIMPPAYANAPGKWGYSQNGADWGGEFPQCDGKSQTPINIKDRDVQEERGESIIKQLAYKPIDTELENVGGKTVQANANFGSFKLPDGEYEVKQFHFHFPAEHTIEGRVPAGELHIVHQKRGSSGVNDLAVIGIMLTISDASDGPEGEWLSKLGFGTALPASPGSTLSVTKLDLMAFASQLGGGFYHYKGSLTTPPCAETVHWYVLKRGIPVTKAMVDTFKSRFPPNNRATLPLNGRMLYASTISLPGEF